MGILTSFIASIEYNNHQESGELIHGGYLVHHNEPDASLVHSKSIYFMLMVQDQVRKPLLG